MTPATGRWWPLYDPDGGGGDRRGRRAATHPPQVVVPKGLGGLIPSLMAAVRAAVLPSLAWLADPEDHSLDLGTVARPALDDTVPPGMAKSDLADWLAALDAPPARLPPPPLTRTARGCWARRWRPTAWAASSRCTGRCPPRRPSHLWAWAAARHGGRHPTGKGWRWAPCRAGRGRRGRRCLGRRPGPGSGCEWLQRRRPRVGAGGAAAAGAPHGGRDGAVGGAG